MCRFGYQSDFAIAHWRWGLRSDFHAKQDTVTLLATLHAKCEKGKIDLTTNHTYERIWAHVVEVQ
jgi:hypothetical protein